MPYLDPDLMCKLNKTSTFSTHKDLCVDPHISKEVINTD